MATLLVRNVDDALHARLKDNAQLHHRSLEEEVRETLRLAVAQTASTRSSETLVGIADRLFGEGNGFDLELPPRHAEQERPPLDFDDLEHGS